MRVNADDEAAAKIVASAELTRTYQIHIGASAWAEGNRRDIPLSSQCDCNLEARTDDNEHYRKD